jgi:aspartate/methionine/tyrosine aminotransferase
MEALREANEYIAQTGGDAVHLSLGQPGKGAPAAVIEEAKRWLESGDPLGYTEASGMRALRERIGRMYYERYGVLVPWQQVFITIGSSAAFAMSLLAAFDAGDRVALVEPCYPAYRNMLVAMGLEPVLLRGTFANNFQPDLNDIRALDTPIQGLIVASPSNPTGTLLSAERMEEIAHWCKAQDVRLISDEIYHGMVYDGVKTPSARSLSNESIIINSFSKYYLMPGWRLGWVVSPPDLVRSYESLLQSFFVSPPALPQHAALKVFDCIDELDATVQEYDTNRKIMLEALPKAGFSQLSPAEGAFYIYANIGKLAGDSAVFCRQMLENTQVVAVPGHDFDTVNGGKYVRFSYAGTRASVEEAMRRLVAWLG